MSSLLVDTNVFSLLFKQDSRADFYRNELAGKRLHVAFVTVAEIRQWALLKKRVPCATRCRSSPTTPAISPVFLGSR